MTTTSMGTPVTTGRMVALVAGLLVLVTADSAWAQCAMCRSTLAADEGLVAAFRSGILFLLGAPFVAFGTVAFLAVRAQRAYRRGDSDPRRPPSEPTPVG